jgi:predicted Ser/Thr protein kinase
MNFIGAKAVEGKSFDWQTNDRLRRALELKLFEDQKDSIKLKTLVSPWSDKETQEKIDIIKSRLMRYFGYNEVSATGRAQLRRVDLRPRRRQAVKPSDPPEHPAEVCALSR